MPESPDENLAKSFLSVNSHNPDVLSCLANLSNDEVFTPPNVANAMLDMLPQELFKKPDAKFLDPVCKSGVFLREITKRLMHGLEKEFPDRQKRLDHILHNQVYGIAITELTSLLSRRTIYCAKYASSPYSISKFDNIDGNIRFKAIQHTFDKNGKCVFCGAPQTQYKRAEGLETHAYEFIHTKEIFGDMKFDVIIGNPPYQMSDGGGTGDSAKPIYQLFVENAIMLNPNYISMIIPARWMKGGKGLDRFRQKMIKDTRLEYIYDFENAATLFGNTIHIDGGACYFLWNKQYNYKVNYHFISIDGTKYDSLRYLHNGFSDTIIRDERQISIISKIKLQSQKSFSSIVLARNPFGFFADLFNEPNKYKNIRIYDAPYTNCYTIFGVKGKKGGAKRVYGFIDKSCINKNIKLADRYKLFFSKAYSTTATVPPKIIVGEPKYVCTETFLSIGNFEKQEIALNCLSYIKTKFFRALLFFNRSSLNISQASFDLIPLENFEKSWADTELYSKYNLTQNEIDFIESIIKPMDTSSEIDNEAQNA